MNQKKYIIIGAGLAGLSLGYSLSKKGCAVTIFEQGKIGNGASGASVGLANPATALNARLSWKAEECLDSLSSRIDEIVHVINDPIVLKKGLFRVASNPRLHEKFHLAYQNNPWPTNNWASWKSPHEVKSLFPEIADNLGALFLDEALSISIPNFLKALKNTIEQMGNSVLEDCKFSIEQFELDSKTNFEERSIIVWCGGQDLDNHPNLAGIQLHGVKGQLDTYSYSKEFLAYPISSQGYMDQLSDNSICIGSTYNHHFDDLEPTLKDSKELEEKFAQLFPTISLDSKSRSSWTGVRTSTKDRMPILGKIPNTENEFIFGGFGSKGLLYSTYLSEVYADHFIDQSDLPNEVDIQRLL